MVGLTHLVARRVTTVMLVTAGLLASLPGRASATPGDTLGLGPRNTTLGGAVTADVRDVGSNYYNPAGVTRGDNLRLSISYVSLSSLLDINGNDSNLERISGLTVGIIAPLRIGNLRFGFGLGVHIPDQRLSRTRSTATARPRWELYDTRPHKVFLSTNVAVRLADWLNVGVGVTFQSASDLQLNITGNADIETSTNTRLRHQFLGDLASSQYFQAGFQIVPWEDERLSIGFSFRQELELRNLLTAVVAGDATIGGAALAQLNFLLATDSVSTYQPHMLTLGIAARPISGLRASMDLTLMLWSNHPSLIPSETIVLTVPGLEDVLGLPDEIPGRSPIPLGLSNTVVPRIGIEYDAIDNDSVLLQVRAGYVYERSPFPTQRGTTDFVDSDRHSLTLGLGIQLRDLRPTLPGALQFDLYGLYAHLPTRNHIKDDVANIVGDYTAGGGQWGFGAGIEVVFE